MKKDESTPSNRKNIAFGSLDKCRLALSEIYDEDWSKDDKEVIKDEVKVIVRGYVRFFIFERGWSTFITRPIQEIQSYNGVNIREKKCMNGVN